MELRRLISEIAPSQSWLAAPAQAMYSGFLTLSEVAVLLLQAACELKPCCVCSCTFGAFPWGLQLERKEMQLVILLHSR